MTKRAPGDMNYVGEHRSGLELLRLQRSTYKLFEKNPDSWPKNKSIPIKVTTSHLALYTGLLSIWNEAYWPEVITPSMKVISEHSFLSEPTYRSCLDDLRSLGILTYQHSKRKNEAIRIRMQPLFEQNVGTSDEKVRYLHPNYKVPSGQKYGSYNKQYKHHLNNKKNKNEFSLKIEERTSIIE